MMGWRAQRRHLQGVTLIETVSAMATLAVALMGTMLLQVSTDRNIGHAANTAQMAALADKQLGELVSRGYGQANEWFLSVGEPGNPGVNLAEQGYQEIPAEVETADGLSFRQEVWLADVTAELNLQYSAQSAYKYTVVLFRCPIGVSCTSASGSQFKVKYFFYMLPPAQS